MRKSRNIPLLLAISCLQGMVFYGAVSTLYREAAGINIFEIAIIESISLAVSLAMEVPWGVIADRIGYRRSLIICNVLFLVTKIIFWLASGFWLFLIERILLSVVYAGVSGIETSMLYLSCDKDEAQHVFGLHRAFLIIGKLFSALVYTLFLTGSYRLSAFATVVTYGLAAVISLPLVEVKDPNPTKKKPLAAFGEAVSQLRTERALLPLLLCGTLFTQMYQYVGIFLNQLQYVRCGMSDRLIGVVYMLVSVAALSSAFSQRLTRTAGEKRTGLLLLLGCGASCAAMAVTENAWITIAAMLLLCLLHSLFMPLSTMLENRLVTMEDRATALSVNSLFKDGVAVFISLIMGRVADASLPASLALGCGMCLLAAGMLSLSLRLQQRRAG